MAAPFRLRLREGSLTPSPSKRGRTKLRVPQIMVLLDKAVEQLFQGTSSHLKNRNGEKLPQRLLDGTAVDLDPFRGTSLQERILERNLFHWGKTDGALAFQIQQESTTDHVLGLSVGLGPVPREAQPPRQGAPPFLRVLGDHLPDKSNVRW